MLWLLLIFILTIVGIMVAINLVGNRVAVLEDKLYQLSKTSIEEKQKMTDLLTFLFGRGPATLPPESVIIFGKSKNGALNDLAENINKKASLDLISILEKESNQCINFILELEKYHGIEWVETNKPKSGVKTAGYQKITKKK